MFLNKRQQEEVIVIGKQIGCTLLQEQGSHVSRKLFTPVQLPSQLTVYNCISFHIRFAVNMLCSPAEMLKCWSSGYCAVALPNCTCRSFHWAGTPTGSCCCYLNMLHVAPHTIIISISWGGCIIIIIGTHGQFRGNTWDTLLSLNELQTTGQHCWCPVTGHLVSPRLLMSYRILLHCLMSYRTLLVSPPLCCNAHTGHGLW